MERTFFGVDLEIKDGEFVAVMGENGAGKTTLVKMFNGLLKPDHGVVKVDGVDTGTKSVAQLSRNVGLIFQNPDHQLFGNGSPRARFLFAKLRFQ